MTSVIFMGEDAVRRLANFGLELGPHDGLELRGVLLLFLRRRVDCCCCAGALFSPTTSKPDAVRRAMPRATIATPRPTAAPLEGRGICAGWDGEAGALTVWAASKAPHQFRTVLAGVLGLDEERIRVIVPNVGGGFGVKLHDYPEDVLACVAAMRLRRNVRWIEAGREHFVAPVHAREQTCARAGGTDRGAQGLGGALLEPLAYDEIGQPLCPTFMEYALPRHRPSPAPSPHALAGVGVPRDAVSFYPLTPAGSSPC